MLGKIASCVGKPKYIDKMTASKERLAYARILVELNSGEKIIDSLQLKGPDGKLFTQKIVYEVKPYQCFKCFHFGHNARNCSVPLHPVWVNGNTGNGGVDNEGLNTRILPMANSEVREQH